MFNILKNYRILFGVIFCFNVIACSNEVSTKLKQMDLTEAVYASGKMRPQIVIEISPSVQGRIIEIAVQDGDTVHKGQVLVRIKSEGTQANLQAARFELQSARRDANPKSPLLNSLLAQWRNTREKARMDSVDFERFNRLYQQKATTQRNWEQAQTAYDLSKRAAQIAYDNYLNQKSSLYSRVDILEQQVRALEAGLVEFVVKSPIDGRVYDLDPEVGEFVAPPKVLMRIGSLGPMIAEIEVDETDALSIKLNQNVLLRAEGSKNKPFEGVIQKIDPAINVNKRSLRVEVKVEKSVSVAGLSVEANIIIGEYPKIWALPKTYLLSGDSLMVERGNGKEKIKVQTGISDLNFVEIQSGLDTSTQVFLPQ